MPRVHILVQCTYCNGQAYLPHREVEDANGKPYIQHKPCPSCLGSGQQERWIGLTEFALMLQEAVCPHKRSSLQGAYHFSNGEVWDDIKEVCNDCGADLDKHV
jgi:hypothetical protein